MNLQTVAEQMIGSDAFRVILSNPLAQFGPPDHQFLGALWMPERLVPNNEYTETQVRYRTVIANDGTRHSPAQIKGNDIIGSVKVSMGYQDVASVYTAEDYDAALAIANLNSLMKNTGNASMQGVALVQDWYRAKVLMPLKSKIEKMRWEAMVDATVLLRGDNGYSEDVAMPNPAGQRVAAGGTWSSDAYDPLADLYARMEYMDAKGYQIGAIAASNPVIFKLLNNAKVKAAVGGYVAVDNVGALQSAAGRVARRKLNEYLQEQDLPPITPYNLQYRTQTGSGYYLKRDVMVFKANTGRNVEIDLGDNEPMPVRDIAGYVAVGRPSGEESPGIAQTTVYEPKKPRSIYGEAYQATWPVQTDPEAVTVITGIS